MPFNTVSEFEKSFPSIKNLTAAQKRAALEIFNSAMDAGDSEETAIRKAIGAAQKIKAAVDKALGQHDRAMKNQSAVKASEGRRVLMLADMDIESNEHFDDLVLTQKKFEILKVGEFFDQRYGKFEVTEDRLHKLKENFDANVLNIDVAIDLNHDPTKGAYAWINTLSVEGGKLFMTLKDISEEGRKILKEKVFKYFSVEFAPFETVIDGKKATIKDVLRGVALTNRPVIKGMQPTFLSEDVSNLISNKTMSLMLKLAEDLLSRDNVSKADAKFLRASFDEATDEEKTDEVEEKVAEVEAKAEKVEVEADDAEGEDLAKAKAEKAEAEAPDAVKASEMSAKFAEQGQKLSELESWKAEKVADERVAELTLSESTKIGFTDDSSKDLRGFIATLSEAQHAVFKALVPKVVNSAILSEELGSAATGAKTDEESKLAEAAKLSEKYRGEGMLPDVAMRTAQKEVGLS